VREGHSRAESLSCCFVNTHSLCFLSIVFFSPCFPRFLGFSDQIIFSGAPVRLFSVTAVALQREGSKPISTISLNRDGMGYRWLWFEFVKYSFGTGLACGRMTVMRLGLHRFLPGPAWDSTCSCRVYVPSAPCGAGESLGSIREGSRQCSLSHSDALRCTTEDSARPRTHTDIWKMHGA